ncbi:MAG: fasciclin domain-containing protein [Acidobacteriaceae bacterium]
MLKTIGVMTLALWSGLAVAQAAPQGNIVQTAEAAGSFKTLVAAVQAAGLADTLEGKGPYTVFAPTDEAFAKLPAGTVESLLKPENQAKLRSILLYHVVTGEVDAAQVMKMRSAKTLEGARVHISVSGGTVMVNNAKVVKADVHATNGVIHVIDTVLMPPSQ